MIGWECLPPRLKAVFMAKCKVNIPIYGASGQMSS